MWRAMLVDDEKYVRMELKRLFPWTRYRFDLAGEAENGRVAIELIETMKPDLVVTDIRMPEMDGLELISWIGRNHPRIVVAVVSAYNDFPLVREALRLGAVDYLMKAEAAPKTAGAFLERIEGLLESRYSTQKRQEELASQMDCYQRLAIESYWRDLLTGAPDQAEMTIRANQLGIVFENTWFGLIYLHNPGFERGTKEPGFRETLEEEIRQSWDFPWDWNLIDIKQGDFVIIASRVGETTEPGAARKLQEIADSLALNAAETRTIRASVTVGTFLDLPRIFREVRELHNVQSGKVQIVTQGSLPIRKALMFIQSNFTRAISLEEVAGHAGVSKSYLSRVFPEYTGEHFSNYLKRLRIERAKELLRFTDDHIYEIATKVGFWNSRYFSKVFHDMTGITPADYRKGTV